MRCARVKIGRVTLKGGGAQLHVIPNARERDSDLVADAFADHSDELADSFAGQMAGYVVIAWNWDGDNAAHYCAVAPYPRKTDLPTWAGEVLRRDIIVESAKHAVARAQDCED